MNADNHRKNLREVSITGHQINWTGWLHHFHGEYAYIEAPTGELRPVSLPLHELKFIDSQIPAFVTLEVQLSEPIGELPPDVIKTANGERAIYEAWRDNGMQPIPRSHAINLLRLHTPTQGKK